MDNKQSTSAVLKALTDAADTKGIVTLTDADLAILTGSCRRSVQYAIRSLRVAGLIRSDLYGDQGTRRTIQLVRAV
jgi:CRP-like cAMP-binding protein